MIPGAVSEAQLLANIGAMQHRLDDTTRAALEAFFEEQVRGLQLPW